MNLGRALGALLSTGVQLHVDAQRRVLQLRGPTSLLSSDVYTTMQAEKQHLLQSFDTLTNTVAIDFETRAPVDLREVGAYNYVSDQGFEALCLVAMRPDGESCLWEGGDIPELLRAAIDDGATFIAHNACGFDSLVWERLGWPSVSWLDTAEAARYVNLPGRLDELAQHVLGVGKDKDGQRIAREMNRIDPRTGRLPPISGETRARLRAYCLRDTEILRFVLLAGLAGSLHADTDVRAAHQRINARGFALDASLARMALHMENELATEIRGRAQTDDRTLNSPQRIIRFLKESGIRVPDARRETLEPLLQTDLPSDLRCMIEARLSGARRFGVKLQAALRTVSSDGRVRGSLLYCGAQTGRWSGRGMQPQNLPRGVKLAEGQLERLVEMVQRGDREGVEHLGDQLGVNPIDLFGNVVRATIVPEHGKRLVVVDYSQIEARVLLWLAGDEAGPR